MDTQIMVPGILVALKTSVNGGVQYDRRDIERDADGKMTKWETVKLVDDPAERAAAGEVASKAGWLINKLCVRTSFGLLCRSDRVSELDEAVGQARAMAAVFNSTASYSFVNITAIKGRIADNDDEAIRAIVEEAQELIVRMDRSMEAGDVKTLRDAALRARRLTAMLTPEASEKVNAAVEAARAAAKDIVRGVNKKGQDLAVVLEEIDRSAFDSARFSFLDTMAEVVEALPSIDLQRVAELEMTP